MNSKATPQLNITFMSKGNPEAVPHDMVTDLPYESLVHNKLTIKEQQSASHRNEYVMDSLIADYNIKQPDKEEGILFREVPVLAYVKD